VYGNHVISGQQEIYGGGNNGNMELEFDYIYGKTGKYPAIRGFDMMNYNPLYGWEDGTTDRIINWVKNKGGIATSSWHINVPSDFTSYKLGDKLDWTSCTYKPTKSFNAANCLDKSTKEYAYLMLAIDDLAKQLLILQDAKVPLILRPFHEAEGYNNTDGSGAWFWWGSAGSEVYKQLWKLLYTTLTEKYGIHNVIWEVNLYTYANSFQWYPGDNYVDLVAYDKYEGSPSTWKTSAATTVFLALVNDTKDTKMVAMSENDVIPDIQNIVNEGAWWLYFCPWYGDFITSSSNNDPKLLNTIYNSQNVITLDELPTNLYGFTQSVTPTPTPVNNIDLNHDGAINMADVIILAKVFNSVSGDSKYVEAYDLNKDGAINMSDVILIASKFNTVV
ncbi:MAG: glycosyl hydrolase, partial [Bacillota bacterium]|nr:glycosyl hydrolase [Bacillota bacterium]